MAVATSGVAGVASTGRGTSGFLGRAIVRIVIYRVANAPASHTTYQRHCTLLLTEDAPRARHNRNPRWPHARADRARSPASGADLSTRSNAMREMVS